MAKFTVARKAVQDDSWSQWVIVDTDGNVIGSRDYGSQKYAQSECDILNHEACFSVGDRVRVILDNLREGDLATIEQEYISLYPSTWITYIVRFDAPSRYTKIMQESYQPQHLELVNE